MRSARAWITTEIPSLTSGEIVTPSAAAATAITAQAAFFFASLQSHDIPTPLLIG